MLAVRDTTENRLRADATVSIPLSKPANSKQARLVQELLGLHGHHVVIDNDFGDATEAAVMDFQRKSGLQSTGQVDQGTMDALVQPMLRAIAPDSSPAATIAGQAVRVAQRHLAEHPREIAGPNCGPWVRLYMGGHEGEDFLWCAGFVSYVLGQACRDLEQARPLVSSQSCDALARDAKERHTFFPGGGGTRPQPGWIFVRRKSANDWTHTGLVTHGEPTVFRTIEGNTNDDGSREGFEVCSLTHAYTDKYDFIRI
ncbi:MAG TPA: peptidoglycan-binding protein [Dongiaceae bacterium]|nr:peptidoglycan-binding protein [Dongiaceae bacterium]